MMGLVGAFIASIKGRNAMIWFILGMAAPVSLVILFFLPSVGHRAARACPNCSRPVNENDAVCPHCGKTIPVSIEMVKCPSCNMMVQQGRTCAHCGHAL